MKALTLRHPWPFCICHWGKRIENRSWMPPRSVIGQRIAIHGGKAPIKDSAALTEIKWIFDELKKIHGEPSFRNSDGDLVLRDLLMPGIVATAVVDRAIYLEAFKARNPDPMLRDPWFDIDVDGNVGWVLRDVIVLEKPIPCRGAQGLWNVPDDVLAQVIAQGAA